MDLVDEMRGRVRRARDEFLGSWTVARLRVIDGELCGRVLAQEDKFDEACVVGSDEGVLRHGESMLRGWAAASARMKGEPVCSFLKGVFDGVDVAVVSCEAARGVALEALGGNGVVLTPDEVAAMVCGLGEGFIALKGVFPDCVLEKVVDCG